MIIKTAAIFFSPTSSTQSFLILAPFLHLATNQNAVSISTHYSGAPVSAEYQSLNLLQLFAIDINIC